jgi:hypothetical protein
MALNLDVHFFEHPKTRRLVGLLGRGAELLPLKLWTYVAKVRADTGELYDHSTQEIESIVEWWGKSGDAVAALIKCSFIEQCDSGFRVHDWLEHQGHLAAFKRRAQAAAKRRWGDDATSNATSMPQAMLQAMPHPSIPSNLPTIQPSTVNEECAGMGEMNGMDAAAALRTAGIHGPNYDLLIADSRLTVGMVREAVAASKSARKSRPGMIVAVLMKQLGIGKGNLMGSGRTPDDAARFINGLIKAGVK